MSPRVQVRTLEPKADDYTEEGEKNRRWGVTGVIIAHHDSHGLCYDVKHDEDGSIGTYDPNELELSGGYRNKPSATPEELMNFIKTENLPRDVKLSPDLKKRAKFFVVVMLFGVNYYIPVTKEMKRLFNIRIKDGKPYRATSQAGSYDLVDFLRDLIASAYFQVRDTVGSAIHDNLSEEIKEGFERLFSDGLGKLIEKKLKVHQLEDKSEKQVLYDGFVKVMKDIKTGFEIVSVTDSVAFLIWNKDKDEVLFTLQYRAPVGCSLTEVPAGRIDKDIDVKELVVKEAKEEVGVTITEDDVILLNNGKPLTVAPGVLTERCYLAYVEVDSSMIEENDRIFGVPEEGEEIQRIFIPVNDLYMMEFEDMKTYALILHFLKERMEKTLNEMLNRF